MPDQQGALASHTVLSDEPREELQLAAASYLGRAAGGGGETAQTEPLHRVQAQSGALRSSSQVRAPQVVFGSFP